MNRPDGKVTIAIVSWNSGDLLARCLASLRSCPHPIVVVDNASEDGSADMVARDFPSVCLIRERHNRGFAAAINVAAAASTGDYLLFLNADTEVEADAVDALAAFLDGSPGHGGAAGLLLGEDGHPQHGFNVRRFPTLGSCALDLLLIERAWPTNPVSRRYYALDVDVGAPVDIEQPAAAYLMVRRRAFNTVGGMDEEFWPAWFEDVDFCRRLHEAGWRIAFVPWARVRHQGGVAMRRLGRAAFSRVWYRNLRRYFRKHHRLPARALLRVLIVIGMIERAVVSALGRRHGKASEYLQVLRDTLRSIDGAPAGGAPGGRA